LLLGVGVVDDLIRIRPYQKLIGQVIAAGIVVASDLTLTHTGWRVLDMAVTMFWVVGITNAFNLLDNMDGLAGGTGIIAASFLAFHRLSPGDTDAAGADVNGLMALQLAEFAGAVLGFLVYNCKPASIFMGDGGALFMGFFLATMALVQGPEQPREEFLPPVISPILILAMPIADTTFVTVMRVRAGRSVFQGGRDHMSHRLVALGRSERQAVGILYGLAVLGGLVALAVDWFAIALSLILIAGFVMLLARFAWWLASVNVYDTAASAEDLAKEKKGMAWPGS
jgi:UDP-GlcNAc:undecaprenyl-phosphate GlcNAc-1-phosphate transferase